MARRYKRKKQNFRFCLKCGECFVARKRAKNETPNLYCTLECWYTRNSPSKETRKCTKCKEVKAKTAFTNGVAKCKECRAKATKSYREKIKATAYAKYAAQNFCNGRNNHGHEKYEYSQLVEKLITDRLGKKCAYCPKILDLTNFSIDHIQPVTKEGPDSIENLQLACLRCNGIKSSLDHKTYLKFNKFVKTIPEYDRKILEKRLLLGHRFKRGASGR